MSVRIEGRVLKETDKAIQFKDDEGETNWFPLSQVDEIHRSKEGDTLVVSDWIAAQKGY